jgi:hypothetical protein
MKTWRVIAAVAACAAVWGGWTLWRANSELIRSRATVSQAESLAADRIRWTPPPSAFESVPAEPQFVDATVFADSVWLAARAGLFRYSPQGELQRSWRVGSELPQAPPTRLAVGLDPASQRRALFVATAGAGLLAVSETEQIDRISPTEEGLRNLTALLPRSGGEIVLGSLHAGVAVYSAGGLRRIDEAFDGIQVTALAGGEGDLWVGTVAEGLLRWTGGRVERWGTAELLPDQTVLALAGTGDRLFAGTPAGVAELESGRVRRTLADGFLAQALWADEDKLLVGSLDEGLFELPLASAQRPTGPPDGPDGVVRVLESGDSMLALTPHALYLQEPGARWETLIEPGASLSARNITALHADEDGRLWIGYFDRGLDILGPDGSVQHQESDRIFCVNRIVSDSERDRVAVATANGLTFFDPAGTVRETYTRDDGLIADHVSDIAVRPEGLALATAAGVTYLEPGGPRSLYAFHGLVNNHVYAVAARGRELLAGTLGGLSVIDAGAVRASYTTANSNLRHNWINAVVELDGAWYVGTYGAGVARLDESGIWMHLPGMEGMEINPGAMTVSGGRLYAGILDRGLLVYEPDGQRSRFILEGLPSPNVTAVEAHSGVLWVGTDNGLVKIAEEALLWP